MRGVRIGSFGDPDSPWSIPGSELERQAIGSIRGYVYQIHQSAAAWIGLEDGDLLHLEVAEDYSQLLRTPGKCEQILQATQVKDTRESGTVTLNSTDVLEAIEHLFSLRDANPGRPVRLTFLTTSEIGRERKNALPSGTEGLRAWSVAAAGGDVSEVRAALLARFVTGVIHTFVSGCTDEELRSRLLAPMTFACGARAWQAIEENNRAELVKLRHEVRSTTDMARRAYNAVFRRVIDTILTSETRQLDRPELIGLLELETSIALPSQTVADAFGSAPVKEEKASLDIVQLRALAKELLETGKPPSVAAIFSEAPSAAQSALAAAVAIELTVVEREAADKSSGRISLSNLLAQPSSHHLIVGPPGSGKSHALWQTAVKLLDGGEIVPIYLPAAQFETWAGLESLISDLAPGVTAAAALSDPRICVFIDGWSEFAVGRHHQERRLAHAALRRTRVIANGQRADPRDSIFKTWSLETFSSEQVITLLASAGRDLPTESVLDLLRLPLLLSMYLLSGSNGSQAGELLRQFHDHLAQDLPEAFTAALAGACAGLALTDERSWGRFQFALQDQAQARGVAEPLKQLYRLGTISERAGQVAPIHDLYWNWLAGRGLLARSRIADVIVPLRTREGLALALQSGVQAIDRDVDEAGLADLPLAAAFDRSQKRPSPSPVLAAAVERAMNDARLAVRNRGALAALESERPEYLMRALNVLAEVSQAKLYLPEWADALRPDALFTQRAILADWIGSNGSEIVIDAISSSGGAEWVHWFEQLAVAGKITFEDALAAALGCSNDVPPWGQPHLDALLGGKPWKLRTASARGSNRALARLVAADYDRLVTSVLPPGSGGWFHLNRVIVECGDDDVFHFLLTRFGTMAPAAKERLGYAVVDRGTQWIAPFQRVAFSQPGGRHPKLSEVVSLDIDDQTARSWIDGGYEEQGWRVLIARHGEKILPELLKLLPASLGGLQSIPALSHMRFLEQSPTSLLQQIWGRLAPVMYPKPMQDALNAIATVPLEGVPSIVQYVTEMPDAIPAYHINQIRGLYEDWRKKIGGQIVVQPRTGPAEPFPCWIARHSALNRWEDHFTPIMLSGVPDLAVELVLGDFRNDEEKCAAILGALKDISGYNGSLVGQMLSTPRLAALIPNTFSSCFDTFPAEALQRCIASTDIDQDALLFRLSATSEPMRRPVHAELLRQVLQCPINLHHYRYIAGMLRAHSRHEVLELIQAVPRVGENDWIWLVREIETARRERLIDESGAIFAAPKLS